MIEKHISRIDFLENYYEKNFLLVKKVFNAELVSWKDINSALFSWDIRDGSLKLIQNGKSVPIENFSEKYQDGRVHRVRIVKDIFYDYLRRGSTLILNRLDLKIESIQKLSAQLSHYLGERVKTNGYLAFGGDGSFGKHWDTHDVVAVQLFEKKDGGYSSRR